MARAEQFLSYITKDHPPSFRSGRRRDAGQTDRPDDLKIEICRQTDQEGAVGLVGLLNTLDLTTGVFFSVSGLIKEPSYKPG